jgi:Uma2 family endonuclease
MTIDDPVADEDDSLPSWFYPPPRDSGWVATDLHHLPESAPRFELIDGALVPRAPQTSLHSLVVRRLANAVELEVPEPLQLDVGMAVRLGRRQQLTPDLVVTDTGTDPDRAVFLPHEVLLVGEVVSAETAERDRSTKPSKYAKAGIRHFWRVENESGQPVVYVYELDETTERYVANGIYRDRLTVPVPFPMDVDLTTLYRR